MSKKSKSFKISTREKEQSQRQLQVSQLINTSLVECFRREGKLSPDLHNCPLTITKVTISSDLRVAHCFFLPFNTSLTSDQILEAIEKSKYVIRNYVTHKVNLKYSPELRFYYDAAFDNAAQIEALLKNNHN